MTTQEQPGTTTTASSPMSGTETSNTTLTKGNETFNIDKYSIQEIFGLLNIQTPSELTVDNIDNAIIKQIKELDDKSQKNRNILLFFDDMRKKILAFIEKHKLDIEANNMPTETNYSRTDQGSYEYNDNPIMKKLLKKIDTQIEELEQREEERNKLLDEPQEPKWELISTKANISQLNQLNQKTFDRTINIDTRFREDYYGTNSNDFYVSLGEEFKNIISMEVVTIEIPNNRYQLEEGLNSFTILEVQELRDAQNNLISQNVFEYPVYLEPGNYGSSTDLTNYFASEFNEDFVAQYLGDSNFPHVQSSEFRVFGKYNENEDAQDYVEPRIIFRINDRTGFTEIYAKNASSKLIIKFNPQPSNPYRDIGYLLGYTERVYNGKNKHISERIFQFNGLSYFYLAIDDFKNNSVRTITNNLKNSNISENIISRFAMIAQRFGGNFDEKRFSGSSGRKRTYYGPVNMNRLRISLLDEFGNLLDIKNGDWFITLLFRCKYLN